MKLIKLTLMIGLSLSSTLAFSMSKEKDQNYKAAVIKEIQQFYRSFKGSEEIKRKLRYGAAFGLLGIGGLLLYYSWKTEVLQEGTETLAKNKLSEEEKEFIKNAVLESKRIKAAVDALPWYSRAKNNVVDTVKNSFFNLTTFGTTLFVMAAQSSGTSMIVKGILNPLADRFAGIYSVERFLATKTKLNQNIKDLIRCLVKMEESDSLTENQKQFFNITLNLLKKDLINTLGFIFYIATLIDKEDDVILSKSKLIFNEIMECLMKLNKLQLNSFDIKDYKEALMGVVDNCESFQDNISLDIGTDLLDDLYAGTFNQLKKSINSDIPAKPVEVPQDDELPDLDSIKQNACSFS